MKKTLTAIVTTALLFSLFAGIFALALVGMGNAGMLYATYGRNIVGQPVMQLGGNGKSWLPLGESNDVKLEEGKSYQVHYHFPYSLDVVE